MNSRSMSFAVVLGVMACACSSDSNSDPKVEPSPFDGDYLCTEGLQTCAARELQGTIEYPASARTTAPGKLDWHEIGDCTILHDLVGSEATLAGTQHCKYDPADANTVTTLVSNLSFASDASEVSWYAHQMDSDGCDVFHNATCKRQP